MVGEDKEDCAPPRLDRCGGEQVVVVRRRKRKGKDVPKALVRCICFLVTDSRSTGSRDIEDCFIFVAIFERLHLHRTTV